MRQRSSGFRAAMSIAALAVFTAAGAGPQDATGPDTPAPAPRVEQQADRILYEMGVYLAALPEFSFHADVVYDAPLANGQLVQYGGRVDVVARRPDRLHSEFEGDERRTRVVFDGRTITILDLVRNLYAATPVPPEIGAALDHLFDLYDASVPIADLVYPDPYATLIENVDEGILVGRHVVDGVPCHHLAFAQELIDWQIWIEDGPQPLPRKLLIAYKDEPGKPQYTARLSRWNLAPRASDDFFRFDPPAGSAEIDFLPRRSEP